MSSRKRPLRCAIHGKASSQFIIYAVILADHPDIVKLGRTVNWRQRRKVYDYWNLRQGDGISDLVVYCITEEYIDLGAVESACLGAMNISPHRGNEWFKSDLERARRAIESVLASAALSYIEIS